MKAVGMKAVGMKPTAEKHSRPSDEGAQNSPKGVSSQLPWVSYPRTRSKIALAKSLRFC